jgi:hypothetical protein
MTTPRTALAVGALVLSALLARVVAQAPPPTYIPQTKFDSGQGVVPVYEGWIRNPDGSFDMVFGYFNRNFAEELPIPPGPANAVEPGGPDRGQPTYFLTRRRARLFRVRVPADWGEKVLTWTITANGHTEKAYGDLLPVEEINEHIILSGGNTVAFGDEDPNMPPVLTVAPVAAARAASPVSLVVNVTDDGLPRPRKAPARTATATLSPGAAIQRQTNSVTTQRPRGLTVTWFQYGGPGRVAFEPAGVLPVTSGTATTAARFPVPGAYTLVATASDGQLSQRAMVKVDVGR